MSSGDSRSDEPATTELPDHVPVDAVDDGPPTESVPAVRADGRKAAGAAARSADSPFPDADRRRPHTDEDEPLYPPRRRATDRPVARGRGTPETPRSSSRPLGPDDGLYPTPPPRPAPAAARPVETRGRAVAAPGQGRPPTRPYPPGYGPPPARPAPPDYYLGTDWLRVAVGTLASLILLVGIGGLGYYLFDRIDSNTTVSASPTSTAVATLEVDVFRCAGDEQPLGRQPAPAAALIGGRNAAGTWLAFRNQQPPPRQLWVRAADLPTFEPSSVGIVSCATSDTEFPTSVAGPTPTPDASTTPDTTPFPTATPKPTPTPLPVATATPRPAPTPN
jgi:hypothetical protein